MVSPFSDWLKRQIDAKIRDRGIVALREVEIRRGESHAESRSSGERTDLHVTALVPGMIDGQFEHVRVILEVKGCWNRELKEAMKTQLVERYLKANSCRHGIYIVGWFPCDQWDDADWRQRAAPPWTLMQAQQFFKTQAEVLSSGVQSIRAKVLNTALR